MNRWFDVNIIQKFNRNRATTFSSMKLKTVDPKNSPDVRQFRKMVEKLNPFDQTDDIVEFFTERFKKYNEEQLIELEIEKETTKLIDVFSTSFLSHMADITVRLQGLEFLVQSCQLYDYTLSEENRLILIVSEIANSNDSKIINTSMKFVEKITSLSKFYPMFFTGDNLCTIWNSIFVSNVTPSQMFGPLFIKASKNYVPPNIQSIQKFLDKATGTFETKSLKPELQPRAIEFIGAVIYQIDTKEFVKNFFVHIKDDLSHLGDYQSVHNLLIAKSTDDTTIWLLFNEIFQQEGTSREMLLNALKTVHRIREHEQCHNFDLTPYVKICAELDKEYQRYLFETAQYYSIEVRISIFKETFPPWVTHVDSEMLAIMVTGSDWEGHYDELASMIREHSDFPTLYEKIIEDRFVNEICSYIFLHVSQDWADSYDCIKAGLDTTLHESDRSLKTIEAIATNVNPELYVEVLVEYLKQSKVNALVFNTFGQVAYKRKDFVKAFVHHKGLETLTKHLGIVPCLDFIALLASDGPHEAIDQFISQNDFHDLDTYAICRLMCGLPQTATELAVIRIPALCKYVDPNLETIYDKYVFGKYVERYMTPKDDLLMKAAHTYMSKDTAERYLKTPDKLLALLADIEPRGNLYQFHPRVPQNIAFLRSMGAISFWIWVQKNNGPTPLFTVAETTLSINENKFCINDITTECTLNHWHMITFVTKSLNPLAPTTTVYIDCVNFYTISGKGDITIGGPGQKSIWYMEEKVTDSSNITEESLRETYDAGPHSSKSQVKLDLLYVPYGGVIANFPAYGGNDIFWNACFNCKLEVHMRGLIESAFSLAQSGVFTMDELFKGFKATFIQRPDLLTTDIAQCLVETSSKDPKSSPELLRRLFGSFFYLAAPNVDHTNLPEVIERIADPSDILSILLMSVIFFDLNEETVNRFFEVIEKVVKSKPTLVKKLLTFARGLPFIDEETIKTPEDPRFDVHQDRVLDIAIKAGFPQKADEILDSFLTLSQRQMLVIFKLFTKKCIANNTFFDVKTFQALEQGLQGFVLNEEMWLCMLSLVGSYEIKTFKDFNIAEIQEPNINVVHMMISLTTVLLQRVTNDPENELARTIVSIVCKIVVELSKKGEDIIQHFAPLCAVGYNQFQPTPFPHTLAPDESIKTIDAASPKKPDYITVEDMTLVEDEMSKIENCPEPKYKQPEDVTFDDNTASAREISRTASTLLAQSTVNLSSFKKALYLLTVQGADVNPTVAVIMHRSIISDFIAIINDQGEEYTLPQDINSYLLEFISARLMEGWWKDYENIIIRQIFNLHPINEAAFYPVCLITDPVGSAEKVISSSVFSGFTREEDNCAFIAKVILDNEDFPPDCIDLLINKSLNSKFSDALKKDKLNAYFTQEIKDKAEKFKEGAYNQIKKDEPAAHQLRFKMSSRPQSQLFNHRRNVSSFICRQYMKRRFAIVYNMNCVDSEEIIGRVFQTQQQQKYFLNPTEKYCVQRSSSPLSVPSKVIPLTYEFVSPHQRSTNSLQFVMSQHETYLKFTVDSMRHPQSASQCLTGIHLPLYIYDGIVCAKVFMEKFGVQSLFQCSLFMSSELLSCVGALTKETFILLMNASYKDGGLTVYKGSQTLCSYEPLEDSTAGLWGESTLFFHNPVLLMEIDGISKIEKRRFVYEQRALDIFMCDGRHITLILDENERKTFLSKIKPPKDDDLLSKPIAEITKMWCKGDITTYDYLLAVNDLGGRSFNDFSQYPVFPWVIGDYTHDPPTKMRDLTKPMGMQTEERAKRFITTYEESPEHYHYGTHYSHPAAVFHFMLRLEPYTLFFFHLHSGWDHRDRIFCDVNDSWLSASETNQTDLKELIPEFFSFPMFLKNTNDLPIQDRTDGKKISNVILPPWGADPLQFIWRNRIALENQDISPWIDLIFGYKSRGQGAKDANNLFLPTAYSLTSNIRDENGEIVAMDPQGQADAVNNFGQCPIQVFQQQHPPRDVAQLVTIINSPMYINITKLVTPEGVNKVYDEEGNIVFTGDHESRLGFSKRRIDECVSYTNSPDSSMVAVASPHGIVTITFALNYSTKNIALPGSMPVCLCLPRLGHFLLVSTEKGLYVFDIVSGFLSMKKDLAGIKAIAYDDISHVIYAMTDNKIYCIYSDFTDIADIELSEECISITDSARTSFDEKPFFAVGFANGHVAIFELDILQKKIQQIFDYSVSQNPIISLRIVANGGAIVALDDQSQAYSVSPSKIGRKFVQDELFDACVSCGEKKPQPIGGMVSVAIGSGLCTVCGRYTCNKCLVKGVCQRCRNEPLKPYEPTPITAPVAAEGETGEPSLPVAERSIELPDMPVEQIEVPDSSSSSSSSSDDEEKPKEKEEEKKPKEEAAVEIKVEEEEKPKEEEEEKPKEEEEKPKEVVVEAKAEEEKPKDESKKEYYSSDAYYSDSLSEKEEKKGEEKPKEEEKPKVEEKPKEEPKKEEEKPKKQKVEYSDDYSDAYYSDSESSEKKPKKEEKKVEIKVEEKPKEEPKKEEEKKPEPKKEEKKKDNDYYYSDEYYSDSESEKKPEPKKEIKHKKLSIVEYSDDEKFKFEEKPKEEKKPEPKKEEKKPEPKKEEEKPKTKIDVEIKKKDNDYYYSDEYYSDSEDEKKPEPKKEEKKPEPKKEEKKPEPKKEEKKPEPKKEEKKPEPKKEEKKPEPKKEEKKPEPKKEEKKPEPKKEEKKPEPKKEEKKPEPKKEEKKPKKQEKKDKDISESDYYSESSVDYITTLKPKEEKKPEEKPKKEEKKPEEKPKEEKKPEEKPKKEEKSKKKDDKKKKGSKKSKNDDQELPHHHHHRSKHRLHDEGGKHTHRHGHGVHHAHKGKNNE